MFGTVVAHENRVYASYSHIIYAYSVADDEWSQLKSFKHQYFSLAIIDGKLTTIGGWRAKSSSFLASAMWSIQPKNGTILKSLLDLYGDEIVPSMPTARM